MLARSAAPLSPITAETVVTTFGETGSGSSQRVIACEIRRSNRRVSGPSAAFARSFEDA